jgi:hypothetical protein
MKSLGVEYVVVHGPKSDEHYRDYRNPRKFDGVLEQVESPDDDDLIYRVPFRGLAHLIRPEEQPVKASRDQLAAYVAAIEDNARPQLSLRWLGKRDIEIDGPVAAGMLISVQVTHDDGWEARQDGKPVKLTANALGFIDVHARPAASTNIRLHYNGTIEQRLMAVICCLSWIAALIALRRDRIRGKRHG